MVLSAAAAGEKDQLQNEVNDEAASDPTSEEDNDGEKFFAEGNQEQPEEQQGQEQEDAEVATSAPAVSTAGRVQRPEIEDIAAVASRSKIPRTRLAMPRLGLDSLQSFELN